MREGNSYFGGGEIPWPEKGDVLFASGRDWWNNACLNYTPDSWELYIAGYKRAADVLVEQINETRKNQDVLVYPVVFLYRQYLELRMKRLIELGNDLLNEHNQFPKKHELNKLWDICKPILSKVEPTVLQEDLDAVGETIHQFSKIDLNSENFRYPVTKQGDRTIPLDILHINFRHLSEVIEKTANFLESVSLMTSVYLDRKNEIDSYFRDYCGQDNEFDDDCWSTLKESAI